MEQLKQLRHASRMSQPTPTGTPDKRPDQVREMFGRIAGRYDLMNRVMSGGRDGHWRRLAAESAEPRGARILDIGSGTGDLARELQRQGTATVVAADFTRPMLLSARVKQRTGPQPDWLQADAVHLPFADATFDGVTSGFLLRNLVDLEAGLAEMLRVLVPGGRLVALDITHPPPGLYGSVLRFGFERVVTPIAGLLSGDRAAYRYLPHSLSGYPDADSLTALLSTLGAADAGYRRLGGGAVALHVARKPS
jgi:demethylmenaquinone methyltransferase/2-methoxy-6-polyprenyl-1,4-benzoquinol methylase